LIDDKQNMSKYERLQSKLYNLGGLLSNNDNTEEYYESLTYYKDKISTDFIKLSKKEREVFLNLIINQTISIEGNYSKGTAPIIYLPLKHILIISLMHCNADTPQRKLIKKIDCLRPLLDPVSINHKLSPSHGSPLKLALTTISLPLIQFLIEEKNAKPAYALNFFIGYISWSTHHKPTEQVIMNITLCYNYIARKINLLNLDSYPAAEILISLENLIKTLESSSFSPLLEELKQSLTHFNHTILEALYTHNQDFDNALAILKKKLQSTLENEINRSPELLKQINSLSLSKASPLHCAILLQDINIIEQCINSLSINSYDERESTPLHYASIIGSTTTSLMLLGKGATLEAKNDFGYSALHLASAYNHLELVNMLLDQGADINTLDMSERQPLHHAAARGNSAVIKALLVKGANLTAETRDKNTALHYAAVNGHLAVVEILLRNGANPQVHNMQGETAISLASRKGHYSTAQYIKNWKILSQALDQPSQDPNRILQNNTNALLEKNKAICIEEEKIPDSFLLTVQAKPVMRKTITVQLY
jgi:ankyrin repeat protein